MLAPATCGLGFFGNGRSTGITGIPNMGRRGSNCLGSGEGRYDRSGGRPPQEWVHASTGVWFEGQVPPGRSSTEPGGRCPSTCSISEWVGVVGIGSVLSPGTATVPPYMSSTPAESGSDGNFFDFKEESTTSNSLRVDTPAPPTKSLWRPPRDP